MSSLLAAHLIDQEDCHCKYKLVLSTSHGRPARHLLVAVDWGGLVVAARFESASVISGGMVVVVVGAKVVVVGGALANFIGYHTELQSFQNVSRS